MATDEPFNPLSREDIDQLLSHLKDEHKEALLDDWEQNIRQHWERLDQSPAWEYKEDKLPTVQYFLRFDGNLIRKFDVIPELIKSHIEKCPGIPEVRMIFKPNGTSKFNHSLDIEALRRSLEKAVADAGLEWRLRELFRFNNDGFHHTFRAGSHEATSWVSHGIILVFTPFGVQDI